MHTWHHQREATSERTGPERVVLVTGASSGIGAAVARLCADRGDRLVLVARDRRRLDDLAGELARSAPRPLVLEADLADASEADQLVARTLGAFGRLDVLINNAGFGRQVRFEQMAHADLERMFQVNVLAAMALARAAIPAMRRQGGGAIVNVASVGGVVAHPLNVAYCASKHAVVGFSKALRLELAGTGIRVTAVCPGATRTEFFQRAQADLPFDAMIERWTVAPEVVARTIVRASVSGGALVFPTLPAWALFALERWLPWVSDLGNVGYRDRVLVGRPAP